MYGVARRPYNPAVMSDQPPAKSWQSRIIEATDALAQSFVESISYDRRLYRHDIAGSIAHATMLAKVGLITDHDRDAIEKGLKSIERDIESGNFHFDESLEDIHMVIEAELIKRIGEPGRRLHTGRSRNDQVATDLALWLREAVRDVWERSQSLIRAFVDLADRSGEIVMPSYTHLQRAQPIFAGAEALTWAWFFRYATEDTWFELFMDMGLPFSPLGAGAIAGTSLPISVTETSNRLSLVNPEWQLVEGHYPVPTSIALTASRDDALDFLYHLAKLAMHLSRWAEQWIIYSSIEFSFIKTADRYTTGSSMMPQKRNPDMLELIRGRCGTVYGNLFALLTILKGLPIGYNRDLQEDKRHVFQAYDTVSSCLTMAAAIVSSTNFLPENIERTLEKGFLDATSLAEYFVTKGIPFRTAHQIVGSLVARCERENKTALSQLSVDDFRTAAEAAGGSAATIGQDVFDALGARNVVNRYRSAGAAGGEPFKQQLAEWKKRLGMC
jgi:argininosuccinate lyase